jgi:hypothetical protein
MSSTISEGFMEKGFIEETDAEAEADPTEATDAADATYPSYADAADRSVTSQPVPVLFKEPWEPMEVCDWRIKDTYVGWKYVKKTLLEMGFMGFIWVWVLDTYHGVMWLAPTQCAH